MFRHSLLPGCTALLARIVLVVEQDDFRNLLKLCAVTLMAESFGRALRRGMSPQIKNHTHLLAEINRSLRTF